MPQLRSLDGTPAVHLHRSASVLQQIATTKLASIANAPAAEQQQPTTQRICHALAARAGAGGVSTRPAVLQRCSQGTQTSVPSRLFAGWWLV